jgi:hypothetical protein
LVPLVAPRKTSILVEVLRQFNNLDLIHCTSTAMCWSIKHVLSFGTGSTNGNLVDKWQRLIAVKFCFAFGVVTADADCGCAHPQAQSPCQYDMAGFMKQRPYDPRWSLCPTWCYEPRNNAGGLAKLAAIRRASSRLSRLAAAARELV